GGGDAGADAPLQSLLRPRGRTRGAYDLPRDRGAQGLRRDRRAVSRAGSAAAAQGRRPPGAGRSAGPRDGAGAVTRLVQVALAEDIAEAEELQRILQQAGIVSELET